MDAIIAMIGELVRNNAAYAAEGHVLFNTQAFADYGKLSGRPLDEMIAGARVEVAPYKQHPADFVLWKPSKAGEPEWDSPWGPGRPGWHIECSAMIEQTLGLPIDIHGGGIDLVFPHHENELAQGVCATHDRELRRLLAAQRLPELRRREDVEEPGQRGAGARPPGKGARARRSAGRCWRRTIASRWPGPRRV